MVLLTRSGLSAAILHAKKTDSHNHFKPLHRINSFPIRKIRFDSPDSYRDRPPLYIFVGLNDQTFQAGVNFHFFITKIQQDGVVQITIITFIHYPNFTKFLSNH